MRAYLPFAVAISACWSVAQAAPAFGQVMYQIELNLIEQDAAGKEHCLSSPRLMTLEGQPACIDIGHTIQPPRDVELQESLRTGHNFLVTVSRKNGRVFLDATARIENPGQSDANSVQITTTGFRVVKAITLGQKITLPLPFAQKSRWELLVQEAQKKTLQKDESVQSRAPVLAEVVPKTAH